jgi:hypothetical protein
MEIELGTASISKSQILIKLHDKQSLLSDITKDELSGKNQEINYKDYIEKNGTNLDKNDYERVLDKFKSMDSKVRSHEQLHSSLATTSSSINYTYQIGPDGKAYVNGGYVKLDTSMPSDPKQAMVKLDEIKKASTASPQMSAADASISRDANLMKARLALLDENNS